MLKQGYVDDGIGGGSIATVNRLIGDKSYDEDTGRATYSGTVAQIMELGGFKLKYMIRNSESRPEVLQLYGGIVLGLPWDTRTDSINLHLGVNLSVKRHGIRDGDKLTVDTVHLLDTAVLTRRIMLSQVYSIYDPLGLLSLLTICYKLLLQRLVMLNQPREVNYWTNSYRAARISLSTGY